MFFTFWPKHFDNWPNFFAAGLNFLGSLGPSIANNDDVWPKKFLRFRPAGLRFADEKNPGLGPCVRRILYGEFGKMRRGSKIRKILRT